ncbi:hypothetical protein CsSME_00008384 [Camellia sinensis var. sinensis]
MAKKVSSKRTKMIISSTSSQITPVEEEVIASNEDLIIEILLRIYSVLVKYLIGFKYVSNNWFNLIFESHFAFNHSR